MNRESLEGENRRDGLVRKSLILERRFLMSLIKWLFDSQILDYFTFAVSGRPVFFMIEPVLGERLHLWLVSRLFWGKGHMNIWRHSLISPRNPLPPPYPLYCCVCERERHDFSASPSRTLAFDPWPPDLCDFLLYPLESCFLWQIPWPYFPLGDIGLWWRASVLFSMVHASLSVLQTSEGPSPSGHCCL